MTANPLCTSALNQSISFSPGPAFCPGTNYLSHGRVTFALAYAIMFAE